VNSNFLDNKIYMPEWLKDFMKYLRGLINEAPYKIFIFISPVFLITALIWQRYVEIFFIFFCYSIFGIVWRHAIKDVRGRIQKIYHVDFNKINLWLTGFYQIINVVIIAALIGGSFYWYEWRSSQIKKECNRWALEEIAKYINKDSQVGFFIVSDKEVYNNFYNRCSREKGL